jgi:HSP20 family protein
MAAETTQTAQSGTTQAGTNPSTSSATTEKAAAIPVQREMGAGSSGMEVMNPMSVGPFAMMRAMMDDMDRVFGGSGSLGFGGLADALFSGRRRGRVRAAPLSQEALWLPAIDVSKRGDQLVVHAELPGLNASDINIEVDRGALTIAGERTQTSGDKFHSERSYGSFYRAIPLPENVDPDQIKATFQNGVLEVTMPAPKGEQERKKKIEVQSK